MKRALALIAALAACDPPDEGDADAGRGTRRDANVAPDASVPPRDAGLRTDAGREPDAGPPEDVIPVIVGAGANHTFVVSIDEGRSFCRVMRAEDPDADGFDNPFLLRHVSYTNARFAAGSWRAIWVSTNGYEWTDVTEGAGPAFDQWIAGVAYGNGWWVVTGGYGQAMRSRDLESWEIVSDELPGTEASRALAFGAGIFVTARDDVGWWSSADGAGWVELDRGRDDGVVFADGEFTDDPGYDRARGVRVRGAWPDGIERAEDRDGAEYERVADTGEDPVIDFAFGYAARGDYTRERVPGPLADCLGI